MKLREPFEFLTEHENGIIKATRFSLMVLSKFEPSKIRVTIAPNREFRSQNQNRYYLGLSFQHSVRRPDTHLESKTVSSRIYSRLGRY